MIFGLALVISESGASASRPSSLSALSSLPPGTLATAITSQCRPGALRSRRGWNPHGPDPWANRYGAAARDLARPSMPEAVGQPVSFLVLASPVERSRPLMVDGLARWPMARIVA